jgi:hypothetical protein
MVHWKDFIELIKAIVTLLVLMAATMGILMLQDWFVHTPPTGISL